MTDATYIGLLITLSAVCAFVGLVGMCREHRRKSRYAAPNVVRFVKKGNNP